MIGIARGQAPLRRWPALAAALLLALGWAACSQEQPAAAPEAAEERALPVRTALPQVEDVEDRASLPAELRALRRAELAAEVAGTVDSLSFDLGQRVAAGQVLAAIDTRSMAQAVAEAEAIDRQRRLQFERAERLFEKRSITQQQLLDAVTNRDVAAARLASVKLELSKSKLRAPWAGTVSQRYIEVGDFVTPGQRVAELVDISRITVRAPVPAQDVPLLAVGMKVEIRVDALAGERIEGEIVRLAPQVDPQTRSLDVEVEVANPERRLRPGMPARLELSRRTLAAAVLVPLSAVVDLGAADGLFVVEGAVGERQIARQRPVELGPVIGDRVVVASGLAAGERVVVEGARQLLDGQPVRESER
jgi:membrane fusion protein (multidrug efflux system)